MFRGWAGLCAISRGRKRSVRRRVIRLLEGVACATRGRGGLVLFLNKNRAEHDTTCASAHVYWCTIRSSGASSGEAAAQVLLIQRRKFFWSQLALRSCKEMQTRRPPHANFFFLFLCFLYRRTFGALNRAPWYFCSSDTHEVCCERTGKGLATTSTTSKNA